jgi:hypothetical protein
MINRAAITLSVLLLTGCNAIEQAFTYSNAAKFLKGYATSFSSDTISSEELANFDVSFANIKIGRAPSSTVVLAYINEGSHEWVSSDEVQVFTKNGYLYKTMGLSKDVTYEIFNYKDESMLNKTFITSASFYNPDLLLVSVENKIKKSDATVALSRPDGEREAIVYIHEYYIPSIKWKGTNKYFVDEAGIILRSEQKTHPNLPQFKVDFFYKY